MLGGAANRDADTDTDVDPDADVMDDECECGFNRVTYDAEVDTGDDCAVDEVVADGVGTVDASDSVISDAEDGAQEVSISMRPGFDTPVDGAKPGG